MTSAPAANPRPLTTRRVPPATGPKPGVTPDTVGAGSPLDYLDAPAFQVYWDKDAAVMTDAVRRIGKVE